MRQREGTQDLDEPKTDDTPVTAKLLSLNKSKCTSFDLRGLEVTLGRNAGNTIRIDDNRLSGTHCKFTFDAALGTMKLTDLSTNGTFLGDQKIGKNNEINLKTGDEIYILHRSKVPDSEVLGFAFLLQEQPKSSIIVNAQSEADQDKMKKLDELGEDFMCPICDDLLFQAVTLMPCLHNFCGSCFSDWMAKQKTCPTCRDDVQSVKQNSTINSVIEKFLTANPQKKRPEAEYKQMEENNKIRQTVIKFGEPIKPAPVDPPRLVFNPNPVSPFPQPQRGRAAARARGAAAARGGRAAQGNVSDYSADSSDEEPKKGVKCRYCAKAVLGFQCPDGQRHTICTRCDKPFPDRGLTQQQNEAFPCRCQICNVLICNMIDKDCLRVRRNQNQLQHFKDLKMQGALQLMDFRQNKFEFKVFSDFMRSKKLTCQSIFENILNTQVQSGRFVYQHNRKMIADCKDNIEITITPNTPVCTNCTQAIWFQVLVQYRKVVKQELPQDVRNRGVCWYGVNCNTMKHNDDHAKKLDHMCEQTKT